MNNGLQELAAIMTIANQGGSLGELAQLAQLQQGLNADRRAETLLPVQMENDERRLSLAESGQAFREGLAGQQHDLALQQFAEQQLQNQQNNLLAERGQALQREGLDLRDLALAMQQKATDSGIDLNSARKAAIEHSILTEQMEMEQIEALSGGAAVPPELKAIFENIAANFNQ